MAVGIFFEAGFQGADQFLSVFDGQLVIKSIHVAFLSCEIGLGYENFVQLVTSAWVKRAAQLPDGLYGSG